LVGFTVLFTAVVAAAICIDSGPGLHDWRIHAKELDRMRSHMGHAEMLVSYMTDMVKESRAALIGDNGTLPPLRVAQRKLDVRLEEIRALAVRLKASHEREKDDRLLNMLRSGLDRATTLEGRISGTIAKVEERITQIKAFFDECEARIHGLEAPVLVMATSHELTLHHSAATQETSEAEEAITNALFELQTKWVAFQQTANTLLPQAVAKVFGETASLGDERQNLETLDAAMDRVFDTLPALPDKRVAVS
jgi:chromosome segregation ATPase